MDYSDVEDDYSNGMDSSADNENSAAEIIQHEILQNLKRKHSELNGSSVTCVAKRKIIHIEGADKDILTKLSACSLDNIIFYSLWLLHFGDGDFIWPPGLFLTILTFIYTSKKHAEDCKDQLGFFARSYMRHHLHYELNLCYELQLFHAHFLYKRGFYDWNYFTFLKGLIFSRPQEHIRALGMGYFLREDGSILGDIDYHDDEYMRNRDIGLEWIDISSMLANYTGYFFTDWTNVLSKVAAVQLPLVYAKEIICFIFSNGVRRDAFEEVLVWCVKQEYPIDVLKYLHVQMRLRTADVYRKPAHPSFAQHSLNSYSEPWRMQNGPWSNTSYVEEICATFGLKMGLELLEITRYPNEHLVRKEHHRSLKWILVVCYECQQGYRGNCNFFPDQRVINYDDFQHISNIITGAFRQIYAKFCIEAIFKRFTIWYRQTPDNVGFEEWLASEVARCIELEIPLEG